MILNNVVSVILYIFLYIWNLMETKILFYLMILLGEYHLAPSGSHECDYGISATRDECQAAALMLSLVTPGRSIQEGKGGTCLDGSWGQVPLGCSVLSGGDWSAHYKTSGDTGKGCIHSMYQLVCTGNCFWNVILSAVVKYN